MDLRLVRAAMVFAAVIFFMLGVAAGPIVAQTQGDGVLGWNDGVTAGSAGFHATPDEACYAQFQYSLLGGTNHANRFLPPTDTDNWANKKCHWTPWDNTPCNPGPGQTCQIPAPATVGFTCASGYKIVAPGRCVPDGEIPSAERQVKKKGAPDSCSGSNDTAVGDPIALRNGTQVSDYMDFSTADGRLRLARTYRTQVSKTNSSNGLLPARYTFGLGFSWRFDFMHFVKISGYWLGSSGGLVSINLGDGTSHDFQYNTTTKSTMLDDVPANGDRIANTEYSLSIDPSWPSDLSTVGKVPTKWIMQSRDAIWYLQTYGTDYKNAYPYKVHYLDGYEQTFTYGTTYYELLSVSDTFGRSISFTYVYPSTSGQTGTTVSKTPVIKQATLPDGTKINYSYSDSPYQAVYTGGIAPSDRLAQVQHVDASNAVVDQISYAYEDVRFPLFLTGVTDNRNVKIATFTYDGTGRGLTSVGPDGNDSWSIAYTKTSDGFYTRTVTNPLGKQQTYTFKGNYSGNYNNVSVVSTSGLASTNCPASATSLTYDANYQNVLTTTDEEGRVTAYVRDTRGRPTQITRGSGTASASVTTIAYHPTYNVVSKVTQPGLTTDYAYNAAGQLTSKTLTDTTTQSVPYSTAGQTRVWAYTYGTGGRLASVDGPLAGTSDTVSYTYDAQGALKTITNELGFVTTVTAVNGRGQPTSVTDPNGVVTALTYDDLGRVLTISVDSTGTPSTTTITYDAVGQVTKVTEPNGAYQTFAYDNAKRLITVTTNSGETVTYTRDKMGNATSVTVKRADGTSTYQRTATFDELGRLIRSIGAGAETLKTFSYGYDKTSNLTSVADPRSNVFKNGFDALSRLISETDEETKAVTLTRDGKDDITSYKDPRTLTTTYVRNGFGEVIQEASPDRGTITYTRDARGLVTQRVDGRGYTSNFTYDAAGRELTRTYVGANRTVTFTYDEAGSSAYAKGHLTTWSDNVLGSGTRHYDAQGRLYFDTVSIQGSNQTGAVLAYDTSGNVTQIFYPSGRQVVYARDAQGRVTQVATRANTTSAPWQDIVNPVTWRPFGAAETLAFGNGLTQTFTRDSDERVSRIYLAPSSGAALIDRSYAWTGETLDQISDAVVAGNSQSLTYTPTRRLLQAVGAYGTLAYTYDATGNRVSEAIGSGTNPPTQSYSYPSTSNRLSGIAQGATTLRSLTYDGSGNPATDARNGVTFTYQFDHEQRLVRAVPSPANAPGVAEGQYAYDPFDRLVSRTTVSAGISSSVHYIYDQADHIIAEVDSSSAANTLREYIWLGDTPIAVVTDVNTANPQLLYVHADHLGRPVMMTDASQTKIWEASYKPFGEVFAITGTDDKSQRFPGQWFQIETGLTYNWHRHYDGNLGRYLQPDPLGLTALLSDGPSAYGYAGQSPLVWSDPRGTQGFTRIPLDPNGGGINGYTYDQRLNKYTDPNHNFPYSFDWQILEYGKVRKANPFATGGCYIEYHIDGDLNNQIGTYELGIVFSYYNDKPNVTHRFFRPR